MLENLISTNEFLWIIVLLSLWALLFLSIVLHIVFRKKQKLQLLLIVYLLFYDAIAFIAPIIFTWWLAIIFSVCLILLGKYSEKASLLLYFRQTNNIKKPEILPQNKLIVILSSAFLSFMCGLIIRLNFQLDQ